jgi:hypothetical protein
MRLPLLGTILVAVIIPMASFAMSNHGALGSGGQRSVAGAMATHPHLRSGRFFAHRRALQFAYPFGLDDSVGLDTDEAPPILAGPRVAPLLQPVDRPPCTETTPQGVVIVRGTGCSRVSTR